MPEKRCESEFAFRAGVHVCSSPPFRPFEGGCGAAEGGSNLTERQAVKNAVVLPPGDVEFLREGRRLCCIPCDNMERARELVWGREQRLTRTLIKVATSLQAGNDASSA